MRKGRKYEAAEIVSLLRTVAIEQAAGRSVEQACRHVGISAASYYKWRNRFAGMTASEAKDYTELRRENARLKKLVAEQALDLDLLREVAKGNF